MIPLVPLHADVLLTVAPEVVYSQLPLDSAKIIQVRHSTPAFYFETRPHLQRRYPDIYNPTFYIGCQGQNTQRSN